MTGLQVTVDGKTFEIELQADPTDITRYTARVDGVIVSVVAPEGDDQTPFDWVLIDEHPYEIAFDEEMHWVRAWSGRHSLAIRDARASVTRPPSGDTRVKAPIPGLITNVYVAQGERVEAGQPLLVLEAMKMENEIQAPRTGTVSNIHITAGQTVGMGDVLADIE
ncbi:MAG: biotin/lipoyl-binding protein [Caldilineales bacterium]|nr:biotin/lipoyl-binding protein [Caldilineales bacterium]